MMIKTLYFSRNRGTESVRSKVALDDGKMNVHLELTHGVGWMTGITKPMEVDEKVWVPVVNDNEVLDKPETDQKPAAPVNKVLDNSGMADNQKVRD